MIANFFNQTRPINFLVLSALAAVLFTFAMLHGFEGDFTAFNIAKYSIFFVATILIIFILNFIIRKNGLCEDNSYAILFYLFFWAVFPESLLNGGIFVSNLILLFAFRRLYSLRTSLRPKEKIFDSAFWIGISSLFFVWTFLYLALVYAAIWLFRKVDWKNILIPIVGYITPLFLAYTYLLAFDDLGRFYAIWNLNFSIDTSQYLQFHFLLPLALISLLFILSIYPTTKKSLIAKIDFKSTWQLLIVHLGISIVMMLIAPEKDGSEFTFLFFPLSIIFANFLQILNKYWIKEGIIILFAVSAVLSHL